MHRQTTKWIGLTAVLLVAAMGISQSHAQTKNWKLFSEGIKMALQSTNPGLRESAMLLIVKHGTKLDLKDSVEDLVKFYRSQQAERTRKLALLAIYQLDQEKALELLAENLKADQKKTMEIISTMYAR
jgi:hypothetical protein